MASRISRVHTILPTLDAALKSFISSSASFKIIRTISRNEDNSPEPSNTSPRTSSHPRTLFILDSSYNPPSSAHLALASTALSTTKEPGPHQMLLLFSTQNADKAPSPASFSQRLAMMVLLAEDLQSQYFSSQDMSIDIGLTTAPYYSDKSAAISSAEPNPYPSSPTHVHLLGYDTLIRFLAPKYYAKFDPPLSALAPYFGAGHKLLVLLRPDSSSDNAVTGDNEAGQRSYVTNLSKGSLRSEGLEDGWARQISILEGKGIEQVVGISSTTIRRAAKTGDWMTVKDMCSEGVAAWIEDQGLYADDAKDVKMA